MLNRRHWLLTTAAASLAGCGGDRKRRIAVIPKATSHIFWVGVREGADAAGKEFNVDILWNGPPAETDYSRQIQIVDSMAAQRVDGIAIAAAERKALVSSVERAIQQGIPVTVFDSGLDVENYTSYVATNNVEGGRVAARTLADMIGGKGTVGLLLHAPGSASTMDREKGFVEVIERDYPNIKIVARQYGMADSAKSRAAAENILTAHPNIDGLFASAEPASVGGALAIESRGVKDKVKLMAFDTSDAMVDFLRNDVIDGMMVQDNRRMGYEAVHTLVQKLERKKPPKRIDLDAVLVTKQNLDKPEIRKLLNLK